MDKQTIIDLEQRNKEIIELVLTKMNKCCPGAIDVIGIAGSFQSGLFDERSDLDLCIITNDIKAEKVSKCFILGDVGFDLYCTSWEKMEKMSEYTSPYVTKLLNLKIVYTSNEESEKRYFQLRKSLQEKMTDHQNNLINAKTLFDNALKEYAIIMLSETNSECWFHFYIMATSIESGIFLVNGEYIRKSIKYIPNEISKLEKKPSEFSELYEKVFTSDSIEDLKGNVTKLARSVLNFIESIYAETTDTVSAANIEGTYEEIYSNWKNKVERAVDNKDIYSQFMAIASCQKFYKEMGLNEIKILDDFNVRDLKENASNFSAGMAQLEQLYKRTHTKISKYNSIKEFRDDYLK